VQDKKLGIRDVQIHRPGGAQPVPDRVAVEEPMEVRVNGESFAVIMRTPGADRDLAAGFLLAEDVIRSSRSSRGLRCAWAIAGRTLLAGQHPLDDRLLLVSERTSFERSPLRRAWPSTWPPRSGLPSAASCAEIPSTSTAIRSASATD